MQAGETVQCELHADLGGRGEGRWWDVGADRSGEEALRVSSWSWRAGSGVVETEVEEKR